MKNSPTFALAAAAAFALAAASLLAAQQPTGQQQPTSSPQPPPVNAHITTPTVSISKPLQPKLDRYKGRVLVFNIATIVVQSMENQRMVWSFQYSTELHDKVADMLSAGGYQPGDKVEVYCKPGTTVAIKLKGKPSKPI